MRPSGALLAAVAIVLVAAACATTRPVGGVGDARPGTEARPASTHPGTAASSSESGAGAPSVAAPISTEELARVMEAGEVALVDVRPDVAAYLKAHLPGAVYLNPETLRASRGGVPNLILPGASYRTLFSRLGIRADRPVVAYSAGEARNIDATYLAWILAGFGHPSVRVLDGGLGKWELEGRRLTRRYPEVRDSGFAARSFAPERATLEDVRSSLGRADVVLVDARPPAQYEGREGAQARRGHIPGAVNHYWQDDLVQGEFARTWKPIEELRASYAAQGITPEKEIVTYCNGGLESSHVHFTLRALLGYPRVRVYDGSWTEWAEREELPMATGPAARATAPGAGAPPGP